MPSKGKSISRIRKTAPATESVAATKAMVAVGLSGARRLKLRKMSMSQQTTTMSIGLEMEATDWAVSIERSCPNSMTRFVACIEQLKLVGDKDGVVALFLGTKLSGNIILLRPQAPSVFLDHLAELTANPVAFRPISLQHPVD